MSRPPGGQRDRVIAGCWQLATGHDLQTTGVDGPLERLERCVRGGIRTFDCADIYTGVEDLLGELRSRLEPAVAEQLRIHTKYVPDLELLPRLRREDVRTSIERSTRRLAVERIDLVQFHWWDLEVPGWGDAAQWLQELVEEGRVGALGVTNFDVAAMQQLADAGVRVATHQTQYSLLDRRPARELAPWCAQHGVELLCYGSLAGGLLSERFRGVAAPAADENRSQTKYRLVVEEFGGWDRFQELLEALHEVAEGHGVTLSEVASAWVLRQPQVRSVIVGVGRHAVPSLRIAELELDDGDLDRIGGVLAGASELPGGVYELERDREGRHGRIMRYDLHED